MVLMKDPQISIVIPCYNEEKTIQALLEAIREQTIPLEELEVIIADGFSTDNTRTRIHDYSIAHPELRIQVIDNEKKVIPAGLNLAIRAARGEIIVRMDAHAVPALDYIERSIAALKAGLGDNIGGVIDIHPGSDKWIAHSIAIATAHPLGVGDAKYRWAKTAGESDTVAFGCYYKSTVERIGYFNESLFVNEDYEFNARLREMGYKIWVDPAIRAVYYSRPSLRSLARQYFTYGFWKVRMLRLYPRTLRWRQALPPLFVLWLLMLLLVSIFWIPARWVLLGTLVLYCLVLVIGSMNQALRQNGRTLLCGVPIAIMTMHLSWGSGFWISLFRPSHSGK
jgi:glycosyltransferase involved in cell wall biosynthesis